MKQEFEKDRQKNHEDVLALTDVMKARVEDHAESMKVAFSTDLKF